MPSSPINRLSVLVAAVLAVGALIHYAPQWPWLANAERGLFSFVAGGFANTPLFDGDGSLERPFAVLTRGSSKVRTTRELPTVVSLDDDLNQVFQSQPPSPVDFAVLLTNLKRMGAQRVAVADAMAWEEIDPIQGKAFEQALAAFDAVAVATPLTRAAAEDVPPAAYIRASLPVTRVAGDLSGLPVVNHAALAGPALDADRAFAGFSRIESAVADNRVRLVARWGDRAVLAFPLVAVLVERGIAFEDVEITLGESIRLGKGGALLPIDEFGCARSLAPLNVQAKPMPAEEVFDAADGALSNKSSLVLLRNDRTKVSAAERDFSASLLPLMVALTSEGSPRPVARLSPRGEFLVILGMVVVLVWNSGSVSPFRRNLGFVGVMCVLAAAQWIAYGLADFWLPGLWASVILLPMWLFAKPFGRSPLSESCGRRANRRVWKWRRRRKSPPTESLSS